MRAIPTIVLLLAAIALAPLANAEDETEASRECQVVPPPGVPCTSQDNGDGTCVDIIWTTPPQFYYYPC